MHVIAVPRRALRASERIRVQGTQEAVIHRARVRERMAMFLRATPGKTSKIPDLLNIHHPWAITPSD